MLRFGIEFAPEVVQADGNVRNLSWRVCNAKKVLVSIQCFLLLYIYLADNAWTRNLICPFLVVKVRPQSRGIDFAALVAFAFIDRLLSISDMEGKVARNNRWFGPCVHTYFIKAHRKYSRKVWKEVSNSNVDNQHNRNVHSTSLCCPIGYTFAQETCTLLTNCDIEKCSPDSSADEVRLLDQNQRTANTVDLSASPTGGGDLAESSLALIKQKAAGLMG